jgi:hypothetical protein
MSGLYYKSPSKKPATTMKKIFKNLFPTSIFSRYETGTTGIQKWDTGFSDGILKLRILLSQWGTEKIFKFHTLL